MKWHELDMLLPSAATEIDVYWVAVVAPGRQYFLGPYIGDEGADSAAQAAQRVSSQPHTNARVIGQR